MDCKNKSVELEGDEELKALRMAALATLKSRAAKKIDVETSLADNVSKVVTVITSKTSDDKDSTFGNQHSWRNSTNSRSRTRGRQFPKGNQRSNLIVITPVTISDEKLSEKDPTPQLVLPQHKWCQSVNEDSSSPRTDRRTGPTRFNRHESGSDSSDSDYDNSDNDSYSNETILQDEPSDKFSRLSPEQNTEDSSALDNQQTSDRRLSFQNLDSSLNLDDFEKKETENLYNSSKNVYCSYPKEEKPSGSVSRENESEKGYTSYGQFNSKSVSNEYPTRTREHSPVHLEKGQNKPSTVNGDSYLKDYVLLHDYFNRSVHSSSKKYSEKSFDNNSRNGSIGKGVKNHVNNLSEGDLRFELKKRLNESKSTKTFSSKAQNESYSLHVYERNNDNNTRQICSQSRENHDYVHRHRSHELHYHDQNRTRSRSSSLNSHIRSGSPTKSHIEQNHNQVPSRTDQRTKRKQSPSSDRSYNRDSEQKNFTHKHGHKRYSGSSSSSSTSSTSSSRSTSPLIRSVPSVVKSVARTIDSKPRNNVNSSEKHLLSSVESEPKRTRNSNEKSKPASSNIKPSGFGDNRNNASDGNKRVPVHMRLGTLSRKRVIQMPKDVEAAFVNTSSDDDNDVNVRCKKQNLRVVTEMYGNRTDDVSKRHVAKHPCRNVDIFGEKSRRMKVER